MNRINLGQFVSNVTWKDISVYSGYGASISAITALYFFTRATRKKNEDKFSQESSEFNDNSYNRFMLLTNYFEEPHFHRCVLATAIFSSISFLSTTYGIGKHLWTWIRN